MSSIVLSVGVAPSSPATTPVAEGQTVTVVITAQDAQTSAYVTVAGLRLVVRAPQSLIPTTYDQAQMTAVSLGRWQLDLVLDMPGRWRLRAECDSPRPASREIVVAANASGVLTATPLGALLVTPEGEPIATPDARSLTARRIDRLPAAAPGALAGLQLPGVRDGEAQHVTYETLRGEVSGELLGVVTEAEANATASATAAAADAQQAETARSGATLRAAEADAAAQSARSAADNAAAAVANAAVQRATLAALQGVVGAEGQLGVVYGDNVDRGQYRYRSGAWVYDGPTIPDLSDRTGATEAFAADLGIRAASDRLYAGTSDILPEITAPTESGERIVRGVRRADGAIMHYTDLDGPGFESSVAREISDYLLDYRFTGAGDIIPVVALANQAAIYFDRSVGRVVIHDVLIRGDHGLTIDGGATAWPRRLGGTGINALVVYGQSLAIGAQGQPALSLAQPYSNLTFVGGVKSSSSGDKSAFGPLVEDNKGENNATGTNRGETVCSAAANWAVRCAAVSQGVAPAEFAIFASAPGQGGTAIAGLSQGTGPYNRMMAQIASAQALAAAAGRAFAVHAVPYIQGETDADSTTGSAYEAALLQLVADINADVRVITGQTTDVHLLIYQTAARILTSAGAIVLAQARVVEASPLVHFVGPIYHLPHNADGLHSTNVGYAWYGHAIGRAYHQLVVEQRAPDCIWPISATAVGTTLSVRFAVPTLPLVLDASTLAATTDHGFRVVDDAGAVPISAGAVVNGDTVQWTLSRALGANPRVRYALDYAGAGLPIEGGASGNLRDSTGTTVLVNGVGKPLWHLAPHFERSILILAG